METRVTNMLLQLVPTYGGTNKKDKMKPPKAVSKYMAGLARLSHAVQRGTEMARRRSEVNARKSAQATQQRSKAQKARRLRERAQKTKTS